MVKIFVYDSQLFNVFSRVCQLCGKEKHIFLSALGQEKLSQVYAKQVANQAKMFDSLSKDELQILFQLLTKLSQEKIDRSDE